MGESFSKRLSEYFSEMLAEWERDPGENEEDSRARHFGRKAIAKLLQAREAFGDKAAEAIEKLFLEDRVLLEDLLDEHYVRDMLERVPKMVARTMKLPQIIFRKMPSEATTLYLKEATRSYVFGFWQASVALSRAAVEQGLRERLEETSGSPQANLRSYLIAPFAGDCWTAFIARWQAKSSPPEIEYCTVSVPMNGRRGPHSALLVGYCFTCSLENEMRATL